MDNFITLKIAVLRPGFPVYSAGVRQSFFDMFITSTTFKTVNTSGFCKNLDFLSDHTAIEVRVLTARVLTSKRVPLYNYNKMNVKLFNNLLASKPKDVNLPHHSVASKDNVDDIVNKTTNAVKAAGQQRSPRVNRFTQDHILTLSTELINLIHHKKRCRRY